jgi:chromosome partitioning protein
MKTIAFFNNKGGVGKTSMVYHLAWMFRDMGDSVLAVDLDPQSNLTSIFLDDVELERLWPDGKHPDTIHGAVEPLI